MLLLCNNQFLHFFFFITGSHYEFQTALGLWVDLAQASLQLRFYVAQVGLKPSFLLALAS